MTLTTIFRSVLGPSASLSSQAPTGGHSHKLLSERNFEYYHYGSHKHGKSKSKSDKKHAVLSALTLLAFLFFLSILQNCIREQNANRVGGTMTMITATGGTAPTGHQAKDPDQESRAPESSIRRKRYAEMNRKNETGLGRRSRILLSVRETPEPPPRRQMKFIRNFSSVNNWTRELSQVSEKDLEDQKLKTSNFPLYWKNNRFASVEMRSTSGPRVVQSLPSKNLTVSQAFRRFKKRERTSTSTEPMQTEIKTATTTQKTRGYKKPEKFQPSPYIPDSSSNGSHHKRVYNGTWKPRKEATSTPLLTLASPTVSDPMANPVSTTPRNRRSDHGVPHPAEYDDYDGYSEQTRDEAQPPPTSAVGLDLNTFQTFPVYNYYNHRPVSHRENQTVDAVTPEPSTPEIDRMHNEVVRVTTQQPLFHPTKTTPSYSIRPHVKHRNRYPNHPGHYHVRNQYPTDTRYRFSPYRKTGVYDGPHFHDHVHDDYYPPVVLAKYEVQHDEPGFDLMKFLWAMVTSFAKPLTKLVPGFAKDGGEEAQCYDLLVCEAQRVSRFAGPAAEALATTFGTLLTWAATEETRQTLLDAINAGRENTCQQQIRDCEDRSGGKSAMTVIAQVMEMKLR